MFQSEDNLELAEFIISLRHGVRKSRQLAARMVDDPQVGAEARALLGRLEKVTTELEDMQRLRPELRTERHDPIWRKSHHYHQD